MANIVGDHKQQPVLMLGRLGWPLPRIEAATGVRREAASVPEGGQDLPSASLAEHRAPAPKSGESALWRGPFRLPGAPAVLAPPASRAPTASARELYRGLIGQALARGRNAMATWDDLVDDHGFPGRYASVRRFVTKLRGQRCPPAHPVNVTAPGGGETGRLRGRGHSPAPGHGRVPPHAPVRPSPSAIAARASGSSPSSPAPGAGPTCTRRPFVGSGRRSGREPEPSALWPTGTIEERLLGHGLGRLVIVSAASISSSRRSAVRLLAE